MLNFMKNLKIAKRISLLVLSPVAGMAALAGVYLVGDQTIEAAFVANQASLAADERVGHLNVEVLQMRRWEKDFFLSNNDKFVTQAKASQDEADSVIKDFTNDPAFAEFAETGAKLDVILRTHKEAFEAAVESQRTLYGGTLMEKADQAENALGDLIAARGMTALNTIFTEANNKVRALRNPVFSQELMNDRERMLAVETDFKAALDTILSAAETAALSASLTAEDRANLETLAAGYKAAMLAWFDVNEEYETNVARLNSTFAEMEPLFKDIDDRATAGVEESAKTIGAAREKTRNIWFASLTAVLGLLLLIGFAVSRSIIGPVKAISEVFQKVAAGHQNIVVPSQDQKDEIGQMARILASFHQNTAQATRTQSALEVASAPFMLADNDGGIIALNKAAQDMFRSAESDLQKAMPQFKAAAVSGGTVGMFGAGLASNLATARNERLVIGARTFDLVLTPVANDMGERLGTAIEWKDMSAQLATEQQIAGIVHAAGEGDFSRRVDLADKQGFLRDLGKGMNDLTETVDRGLSQTVRMMSALARGDLTQRVEGEFKGAFLQLKTDANSMADKIRAIAKRISGVSREVQGATREIASGVADLSARTEHQASSLEETSASMEELATTVRQNSGNAQEANQLAAAASTSAVNGGEIASRAVDAMGKIEDSSRQIGDIVGLIQDIAFQTNLLALNAAVEAARAGEAGKGFAVVANEVRALAQRAGQASKDIKGLIVNSDTQVREGVTLVKQAGSSLTEIVASVKKVAGLVAEIAAATQEQSSGIEQVSKAVTGMDQMTQQNAALVEETNAALHSATTQVDELRKVVSFFQTGEELNTQDEGPAESEEAFRAVAESHANPVRQRFQNLARRVAAGGNTAVAHDKWKEF